jgi:hypothetical protein
MGFVYVCNIFYFCINKLFLDCFNEMRLTTHTKKLPYPKEDNTLTDAQHKVKVSLL